MATLIVDKNMLLVGATPPRPFSPQVRNGATLADRYAARAAQQWVESLHESVERAYERLDAFKASPQGARPANPTAQKKWLYRVRATLGPSHMASTITPGKRGKGGYSLAMLIAGRNADPVYAGADRPMQWLKIIRAEAVWSGKVFPVVRDVASFSKHSLVRLIQRGGVQSEAELREVLRAMLSRLSAVEAITRERRAMLRGDVWLAPLNVKNRVLIAVFLGPVVGQDEQLMVAKTFLTVDHLREDQLAPMRALVEAFAGQGDIALALEATRVGK